MSTYMIATFLHGLANILKTYDLVIELFFYISESNTGNGFPQSNHTNVCIWNSDFVSISKTLDDLMRRYFFLKLEVNRPEAENIWTF